MTHIDVVTMQDLWKENIDGYFPYLLEIYNPDISWTNEEKELYSQEDCYLRIICDDNKVKYKGKTYLPASFTFSPPESDGTKIGTASLTVTALDYRIRKILKAIKIACDVTVMAFFVKVTKNEESADAIYKFKNLDSISFTMNSASSDKTSVKFNLVYDVGMAQNVPYHIATQDRVPSAKE